MKTITINGEIIPNGYAWLYDWYEMEYTCPANVKDILNALEDGEDVTVIINSGGGDVVSGQEIYSILKGVKNHVTVDVQSMAASAASMIAMAGDTVRMSPVSLLMIHNASTCTSGDYRDMQHTAEVLQTVNAAIMEAYSRKTNLTYDELKDMMDRETWLTANQCVEKGFADELLDDAEPLEISASADSQTISCKGHALRLMPGVKLPDNIPLAKAPAPVAPAAANTKTAVEPANTNEGGQTPMANETNGAQTPTPAVENPQAAVDAAVSAERHRLEEIDQIAGLFNAEMVHEAKYGATACDARELAFRAAKQATQQGRDFLTALGIDNQQSGTQSVSAVPGESAEGSPEGTPAELTPAEKMAAARQSVKALLHPETNKEGKNNG